MSKRVLAWSGASVTALSLSALGWHFVQVGLDEADKLASVVGVFVAVIGLAATIYGLTSRASHGDKTERPPSETSGERAIGMAGGNIGIAATGDTATNLQMKAEASGQGRIYQAGRDQNINEQ
ncbi:hypothetical protein [Nonomuraea jabiensis]|uniref:hypothetical protein n=1 Tax=Nonomuraea jabiensis TaxID=882448 RepID=UPI0036BA30EE